MKLEKIAALALAALLVTAGAAAAMPGNAPDGSGADEHEQASDHRPDDADHAREDNGTDVGERVGALAANESDDDNATERDAEHAANARRNIDAASSQRAEDVRGLPVDMPEQVPDHVTAIHQLIVDFLSGDLDGELGASVSDVTPEDATADASG